MSHALPSVPVDDPMRDAAYACVVELKKIPIHQFAERFVELRMQFFRNFARGLICSTTHGIDYFQNVLDACEGRLHWDEKGELGNNFRKMIAERPRRVPR